MNELVQQTENTLNFISQLCEDKIAILNGKVIDLDNEEKLKRLIMNDISLAYKSLVEVQNEYLRLFNSYLVLTEEEIMEEQKLYKIIIMMCEYITQNDINVYRKERIKVSYNSKLQLKKQKVRSNNELINMLSDCGYNVFDYDKIYCLGDMNLFDDNVELRLTSLIKCIKGYYNKELRPGLCQIQMEYVWKDVVFVPMINGKILGSGFLIDFYKIILPLEQSNLTIIPFEIPDSILNTKLDENEIEIQKVYLKVSNINNIINSYNDVIKNLQEISSESWCVKKIKVFIDNNKMKINLLKETFIETFKPKENLMNEYNQIYSSIIESIDRFIYEMDSKKIINCDILAGNLFYVYVVRLKII